MATDEELPRFTVLDWIGVIVAGLTIVALFGFPIVGMAFAGMFADFGETDLPFLTVMAITPWIPPVLALIPLACLVWGARPAPRIGLRRLLIVLAFALAGALLASLVVGLYLPVFAIAEGIT